MRKRALMAIEDVPPSGAPDKVEMGRATRELRLGMTYRGVPLTDQTYRQRVGLLKTYMMLVSKRYQPPLAEKLRLAMKTLRKLRVIRRRARPSTVRR